jgi:hypothetical protein
LGGGRPNQPYRFDLALLQLGFRAENTNTTRAFTHRVFALSSWADTAWFSGRRWPDFASKSGQALGHHRGGNVEQQRGGARRTPVAHRNNQRKSLRSIFP